MKLWIMSDVHVNWDRWNFSDQFARLAAELDFDAVVLAGDIGDSLRTHLDFLDDAWRRVQPRPVISVLGNHEFVDGSSWRDAMALIRQRRENIHILSAFSPVTIDGQVFAGDTYWYSHEIAKRWNRRWCELAYNPHLAPALEAHNKTARENLAALKDTQAVVISHMLPSYKCVDPQYKNSDTNELFVAEETAPFIEASKIKLWIHGHTHCSGDQMIGGTRVVCNPRGYIPDSPNPNFNPRLVIEV